MSSFNLTHANQLSVPDAKDYIKKHFYPLSSGQHVFVEYDEVGKPVCEIKEDNIIKSVYFNRLPKVIQNYYFKEYDQIKTLTCELNKPFIYDKFINTCPALMHQPKPYNEYPISVKINVEKILHFLKEIWASDNEKQYQFIIKWIANMARGGKNQSVLYLRSEQGIGKSTFTDFLRKHVIGPKLCIQSGSQPLISQFNSILFCKLLVIFEELENFSTNQWQGVSTRLKRDTTSDTCMYEEKNQKAFTAKNISNYIINSNVDAIKDDDGRRYFILDLSNKRKGDFTFFKDIYDNCMNDQVGEAFFSYLLTVDLKGYHDQDFPPTKAKEDAIVKRLDSVAKFLKEKYILKSKDFITNLKDAYAEYCSYCIIDGCKECHKIEFNKRLEALNITPYKSNGVSNSYKVKHPLLIEIANKNKWMHSTDVFESDDKFDDILPSDLDKCDKDREIEQLRYQIAELKKQLEDKNNIEVVIEKPKIDVEKMVESCNDFSMSIDNVQKQLKRINKDMKKVKSKEVKKESIEDFLNDLDKMCN